MRELFDYLQGLEIGQGRYAGQKLRLHPWEKRFIRGAFSIEGDAALTLARGNGKSTLIAALGCAFLDGPLAVPMGEVVVACSSFDQGVSTIFRHVLHFMGDKIERKPRQWRVQDNSNRASVINRENGAGLRVIGSDPRRMHGLQPALVIADECAQWEHTKIDRAIAALRTSLGKVPNSRMIWLGTRADAPDHVFEQALKHDCEYVQVHAAGKDRPPFQRKTWVTANPGLNYLPDLEAVIRREAKKAKRNPALLAAFRALRLNQGVSDTVESVLLDFETWERIEADSPERGGRYVLGIDLGGSAAMSAAAAYWTGTGALETFAVFPETPDLLSRGRADGVDRLYISCAERGELLQAGARVSDVGALLREVLNRWGAPGAIVCDRWREKELLQVLEAVKFPRCQLIVRGQGFKDGGADVREFRRACVDDMVTPARSLLLRAAMAGARVTSDPAGNSKLAKGGQGRRSGCRDDAAAAAILAVAEGIRKRKSTAAAPSFNYAII